MTKKKIVIMKVNGLEYLLDIRKVKVWEKGSSNKVHPRELYGVPGFKEMYEDVYYKETRETVIHPKARKLKELCRKKAMMLRELEQIGNITKEQRKILAKHRAAHAASEKRRRNMSKKKKIVPMSVNGIDYLLDIANTKVWEKGSSDKIPPKALYGVPGFKEEYERIYHKETCEVNDESESEQSDKKNHLSILVDDCNELGAYIVCNKLCADINREVYAINSYSDLMELHQAKFGNRLPSSYKVIPEDKYMNLVYNTMPVRDNETYRIASPICNALVDTSWVMEQVTCQHDLVDELFSRMDQYSIKNLYALVIAMTYGVDITKHQKYFLLWGKGGEGKSALIKTLCNRFAIQKYTRQRERFTIHDDFKDTHATAYLENCSVIVTEEEPVSKMSLKFAKKLSGNISTNIKYGARKTQLLRCNYIQVTNNKLPVALLNDEGRSNIRRMCPILIRPRTSTFEDSSYPERLYEQIHYLVSKAIEYMTSMGVKANDIDKDFDRLVVTLENTEMQKALHDVGGLISAEYNIFNEFKIIKKKDSTFSSNKYSVDDVSDYLTRRISRKDIYREHPALVPNVVNSCIDSLIEISKEYLVSKGYRYITDTIDYLYGIEPLERKAKDALTMSVQDDSLIICSADGKAVDSMPVPESNCAPDGAVMTGLKNIPLRETEPTAEQEQEQEPDL